LALSALVATVAPKAAGGSAKASKIGDDQDEDEDGVHDYLRLRK